MKKESTGTSLSKTPTRTSVCEKRCKVEGSTGTTESDKKKSGFKPVCTPLHKKRAAEFMKKYESGKTDIALDFESYVKWLYGALYDDSCDNGDVCEFAHILPGTTH